MRRERRSKKQDKSYRSLIETILFGTKLASPTMLASGVLGISFDLFPRILQSGAGAIVSKSIGLEPREGYPNPTMTGTDCGYLNAIGLSNPGVAEFSKELEQSNFSSPLIVSIFADSAKNFAEIAKRLDGHDFLGFELNLSCPHVADVGSEIGSNPETAATVVRAVKATTKKPVFAKMPATVLDVPQWARMIERAGADAIVAINTLRAMKIDIETKRPILANKIGGLSGPAIRPIGVRCVYEIYENTRIPIIGVGGVSNWKDAVEYFLAGATCVQIGSAMGTEFLSTFEEINRGLQAFIQKNGLSRFGDLIGLAHD